MGCPSLESVASSRRITGISVRYMFVLSATDSVLLMLVRLFNMCDHMLLWAGIFDKGKLIPWE
eukprot:CAMPEP_0202449412 /NCGR_PEP_ID=MMETSP1360-20130828/8148_1 /ASSEMBLY_ACC=CAM_ASM_000848 /TAXON_ID=515479 /ORGANISM="Licmophora paradoxa, Strain CCMP2313" /LENGTH=62 /DNA_ID=CAMNT_0049067329 /DNA_START=312 /DNA_END=500 /DNA_ORIENTATION=+